MKKGLLLFLGGVLLVIFILGTTYAWYQLFSRDENVVANLAISFENVGTSVNIQDTTPLSDAMGEEIEPYCFTISNTGSVDGTYQLLLKEQSPSVVNDGCTTSTLLSKDQLKYQLVLNNVVLATGKLSDLENDVLDLRKIAVDEQNHYQLRVWIDQSQDGASVVNKHFHYRVDVESVEGE